MKEHPIIFSGPMVRAILDGRKTQTRRVVKLPRWIARDTKGLPCGEMLQDLNRAWRDPGLGHGEYLKVPFAHPLDGWGCPGAAKTVYPRWSIGDRLWVREVHYTGGGKRVRYAASPEVIKTEDGMEDAITLPPKKWRSPIFMPRWASRITLEITDVRVQRVQEISEDDAQAEGCVAGDGSPESGIPGDVATFTESPFEAKAAYAGLWDSINETRYPWASNPWVWVRTFKIIAE